MSDSPKRGLPVCPVGWWAVLFASLLAAWPAGVAFGQASGQGPILAQLQPAGGARGGSPQGSATASGSVITEVRLERSCLGCPSESVIVLRRDGTATLTSAGNARSATVDRTSRGSISRSDFDEVARVLIAQRFFELDAQYAEPELRDGAWSMITVTRAAKEKSVRRGNGAGPRSLDIIERAIDAVRARIVWRDAQVPTPKYPSALPSVDEERGHRKQTLCWVQMSTGW